MNIINRRIVVYVVWTLSRAKRCARECEDPWAYRAMRYMIPRVVVVEWVARVMVDVWIEGV